MYMMSTLYFHAVSTFGGISMTNEDEIPVGKLTRDEGAKEVSHKESRRCKRNFPLVITNKVPLQKDVNKTCLRA